jgi:hypothetical protein
MPQKLPAKGANDALFAHFAVDPSLPHPVEVQQVVQLARKQALPLN